MSNESKHIAQLMAAMAQNMSEEEIVGKLGEAAKKYQLSDSDEEKDMAKADLLFSTQLYTLKQMDVDSEKVGERIDEVEAAKQAKEFLDKQTKSN